MNLHEQAFVESFVQRPRRERALLCLANPKKRRKFVDEFAHHGTYILAPECLSLDGKEMELLPALKKVVGYGMGTMISCLPGRLGYFEGELRERYILQK